MTSSNLRSPDTLFTEELYIDPKRRLCHNAPMPDSNHQLVDVKDLVFRYREGPFCLTIPDLTIAPGQSEAIIGPCGSGKTTLLHLVDGILKASQGQITVDGQMISDMDESARRCFRIQRIGLVFQEFELLSHLNVLDNILLAYRIHNDLTLNKAIRQRAKTLADEMGIGDKLKREGNNIIANASVLQYNEITEDNADSFHFHGDPSNFPITAVIAIPRDSKSSTPLHGRYLNKNERVQLVRPITIIKELLNTILTVQRYVTAAVVIIGIATLATMGLVFILSLQLRRREILTMTRIGGSRTHIIGILVMGIPTVLIVGIGLAGVLALLTSQYAEQAIGFFYKFESSEMKHKRLSLIILTLIICCGCRKETNDSQSSQTAEPTTVTIYTVNYPLAYFAERIGGDHVSVHFPVPADEDPAYWSPDAETILQYQQADLILLNGAGYAKWIDKVSLPAAKLINTSQAVADQYIQIEEAVTHSHGPEGEHTHGTVAFTTWLDPRIAIKQAEAIRNVLQKQKPSQASVFEKQFKALEKDLASIHKELQLITSKITNMPLFFSHPVYQYAIRAYNLNAHSVHWEPDVVPDGDTIKRFAQVYYKHRATVMIWEGEPVAKSVEILASMGIKSVTFSPCGNQPDQGDYLSVMHDNINNLKQLIKN